MDPDPEYWCIYIILHRKKVTKKSQNRRNQGFSYYFCLMIWKDPEPEPDLYV